MFEDQAEKTLNVEHRTSNAQRRTEEKEKKLNIERPTSNVQRRTEEKKRKKNVGWRIVAPR
jgi:hypothetical protein